MQPQPPSHHHYASDSVSLHSSGSASQRQRQQRRPQLGHHDTHHNQDDRSVDRSLADKSVRSAPSSYNHRPRGRREDSSHASRSSNHRATTARSSAEIGFHKRGSSTSDSSCDTTVDLSYSSEFSSSGTPRGSSSSGGGSRRSNSGSGGSVFSQGSQRSAHSARSSGSFNSARSSGSHSARQDRRPRPSQSRDNQGPSSSYSYGRGDNQGQYHNNANTIHQNPEQFVCGMELFVGENNASRCFYTGQIHVESQLPHGLGTLRSEVGGTMLEGEWQFGRLVQESGAAAPPAPQVVAPPPQEYQIVSPLECQEEEEDEYTDFCLPCTSEGRHQKNQDPPDHEEDEETFCENFQQVCRVVESEESSIGNSIAVTIDHADDTASESSSASSAGGWSRSSSYSARESKSKSSCLIPPPPTNPSSNNNGNSSVNSRVTFNKLQEFERYTETCDEEEDYYHDDHSRSSYSPPCVGVVGGDCERPKRVRFREDP